MELNSIGRHLAPVSGVNRVIATVIILVGLSFCYATLPDDNSIEIFRYGAYVIGATLALALLVQALQGLKTLLQPDSIAIVTFYFLTYAEFLSPNLYVLRHTTAEPAVAASDLVMLSFAGLAIGRHMPIFGRKLAQINLPELPPATIYRIFLLFSFLGYFYVLLCVRFNVLEIFSSLLNPRFDTPWQRGQLGGWSSLVEELNLLLYAVAAIGGYIFANRYRYRLLQLIAVAVILLFTFYFDVGTGARNIVLIQVGLFLVAYLLASGKPIDGKTFLLLAGALAGLWLVMGIMLEFRNVGFGAVFDDHVTPSQFTTKTMIDNNMFSIAGVMEVFPKYYDYPGLSVLWSSIIHPIPRAFWPGKPIEWTDSIEGALGVKGATIAVTYAGEAYLIGGYIAAFAASVIFGVLAASWARVGAAVRTNTGLIYYVSGFYAVTLGMRSMQWITVAILPTIAIYVFVRLLRNRIRIGNRLRIIRDVHQRRSA